MLAPPPSVLHALSPAAPVMPRLGAEAAPTAPEAGSSAAFLADVVAGLSGTPRQIPCTWLYDEAGSALFDRITETGDYYPTRAETAALATHGDRIARSVGPDAVVIEYGAGSCVKTRLLLDALGRVGTMPVAYVPLDVSAAHLTASAARLAAAVPGLDVRPLVADYRRDVVLPDLPPHASRCVFFPGSTIGNATPTEAEGDLRRMATVAGPGGVIVVGVDLEKDAATLVRAYDDDEGVTAAFNLNLLRRMVRDLDAVVDVDAWTHRAEYDTAARRVEMYLVSRRRQGLTVGGRTFLFDRGETIWTESSHKYTPERFAALASRAGLVPADCVLDPDGQFSVHVLRVPECSPVSGPGGGESGVTCGVETR